MTPRNDPEACFSGFLICCDGYLAAVDAILAVGLFAIGLQATDASGIALVTSTVSFAVMAGGLMLLTLPETRRRELEQISDEAHA